MQVLAISGSPRRGGNTETLLGQAVRGAAAAGGQVELVRLAELAISPCRECQACAETGSCPTPDDMQGLYPSLRACDRLILASPVFFAGLSAQTKLMVDRCQACWMEKYRRHEYVIARPPGRRGVFISTCGYNSASMFDGPLATVRAFFLTLDIELAATLLYPGMDDPQAAAHRPTALAEAYRTGWQLVAGAPPGQIPPSEESHDRP